MNVTVDVHGERALVDRLGRAIAAVRDLSPGYRDSIRQLERHVLNTFRTQGASSGRKWRRLRPATKRARRRGWGYYRRGVRGIRANIATGQLLRDYVRRGPRHIERVSSQGFEWGADYPSGYGSGRKWYRRTPVRFGRRGQRTAVVLGPIFDHIRRALRG